METTQVRSTRSARKKEVYERLFGALGDQLKSEVTLAPYTTFGIGGKAAFFYRAAKPETLVFAVRTAQALKMRFLVLGGGSNLLVSDAGFKGLAIKNESDDILVCGSSLTCQSGALLEDAVARACTQGLSGLEFAAGIPGTVGGAIRGNAGAFGKSVGDRLTEAVVLTSAGDIKEVSADYFRFAYRESRLKETGDVLLSATLRLRKGDKGRIKGRIADNLKKRSESLPWENKSAGCFFKNVVLNGKKISAGLLLDQVGAKRMHQGDAKVFAGHANILINTGAASSADVKRLATRLRRKIEEKFGIKLEKEVVYIN
jgi:UDP-N-acetylmuramate dehydrogenase